jgi:hypothetical protein
MQLKDIRKTLVAVAVTILMAIQTSLQDGTLSLGVPPEWMNVILAVIGAVLVFSVRNGDKPPNENVA